jgi:Cu/Ag efflux protein CusF
MFGKRYRTRLAVIAAVAAFAAFAWWSLPRPPAEPAGQAQPAGDPAALTDGVVLSVDRAAKNVTISHGAVRNLGMPPMTMEYQVADPALLERIKPDDKVRFRVDSVGGAFIVMNMEPAN